MSSPSAFSTLRGLCLLAFLLLPCPHLLSASFQKIILTDQYFCDGINQGDLNKDGHQDVVAGPYWYQGPEFQSRHEIYPPHPFSPETSPTDSMFSYVHDFNQDGWPDILVFGRVHLHQAFWYQNPGTDSGLWKKHFAFHRIQGESPPFQDVDLDGHPEIVAHWKKQWGFIRPDRDHPDQPWIFHAITPAGEYHHFYHGTGIGDINGDQRPDLILNEGWFEQPSQPDQLWTLHPVSFGDKGGAQMFAYDVDADGDQDVISAMNAHGWGLAWFEQSRSGENIEFIRHLIMEDRSGESRYGIAFSQPHALALADLNGDGLKDIITGKRRWAHGPKGDVEPMADPVVAWFELTRPAHQPAQFRPHLVDNDSGLGVQIKVADMNKDGRPDILTASKLGSFLFLNKP